MKNRVVHFEIQVDDVERAKKFYTDVFGWDWHDLGGVTGNTYWGILTAPMDSKELGINGGLLKRPCPAPNAEQGSNAFVCTIQVEDFDAVAKKVAEAGGKVAMPKFSLNGMAWQGYFLDTEGNTFGLHQLNKNIK